MYNLPETIQNTAHNNSEVIKAMLAILNCEQELLRQRERQKEQQEQQMALANLLLPSLHQHLRAQPQERLLPLVVDKNEFLNDVNKIICAFSDCARNRNRKKKEQEQEREQEQQIIQNNKLFPFMSPFLMTSAMPEEDPSGTTFSERPVTINTGGGHGTMLTCISTTNIGMHQKQQTPSVVSDVDAIQDQNMKIQKKNKTVNESPRFDGIGPFHCIEERKDHPREDNVPKNRIKNRKKRKPIRRTLTSRPLTKRARTSVNLSCSSSSSSSSLLSRMNDQRKNDTSMGNNKSISIPEEESPHHFIFNKKFLIRRYNQDCEDDANLLLSLSSSSRIDSSMN